MKKIKKEHNTFVEDLNAIKNDLYELYSQIIAADTIDDSQYFVLMGDLKKVSDKLISFFEREIDFFSKKRKSMIKNVILMIVFMILQALSLMLHPIFLVIISLLLVIITSYIIKEIIDNEKHKNECESIVLETPKIQNTITNCETFINKKNRMWKELQKVDIKDEECLTDIIMFANVALNSYLQDGNLPEFDEPTKSVLIKMLQESLKTEETSLEKLLQMSKEKIGEEKLEEGNKLDRTKK